MVLCSEFSTRDARMVKLIRIQKSKMKGYAMITVFKKTIVVLMAIGFVMNSVNVMGAANSSRKQTTFSSAYQSALLSQAQSDRTNAWEQLKKISKNHHSAQQQFENALTTYVSERIKAPFEHTAGKNLLQAFLRITQTKGNLDNLNDEIKMALTKCLESEREYASTIENECTNFDSIRTNGWRITGIKNCLGWLANPEEATATLNNQTSKHPPSQQPKQKPWHEKQFTPDYNGYGSLISATAAFLFAGWAQMAENNKDNASTIACAAISAVCTLPTIYWGLSTLEDSLDDPQCYCDEEDDERECNKCDNAVAGSLSTMGGLGILGIAGLAVYNAFTR